MRSKISSPRRTVLAVPGSNSKMIEKSRTLLADEILLDLEDSVVFSQKDTARKLVSDEVNRGGFSSPLIAVRVNEQNKSIGLEDVEYLVKNSGGNFDSLIIPKVESKEQVVDLDNRLSSLEKLSSLPIGSIKVQLQIESALGLLHASKIAAASSRNLSLIFGPGDFAASIGMQVLHLGENPPDYPGDDAYHYALMHILVAARAHGLLAIDGPYSAIDNPEGLKNRAHISSSLGFDGKWVIHPSQIEIVNSIFSPTQKTFDSAAALLKFFEENLKKDSNASGALLFEGKMVDMASQKMAEMIYAKGIAAGLEISSERKNDDSA